MKISSVAAALAIAGLAAQPAVAADGLKVTLKTFAEPADRAGALKLYGGMSDFAETTLDPDVPSGGVISAIDLPATAVEANLFVVWADNSQTAFPIVLASAFADRTVEVYLLDRPAGSRPTGTQVRQDCDQLSPPGLSAAFDMLFTCKGYALALENAGDKWHPDYRRALNGWLAANFRLTTLARPVSPYGVDPDLRSRLEEALRKAEQEGGGDQRLAPLRLADAKQLIGLADTVSVRLVGFLPQLVEQGAVAEASAINGAALDFFQQAHQSAVIDGVSEKLLLDNQVYLDNLIAADW